MDCTGLGERLKAAREGAELSGGEVAAELVVDVRTLYRWERGEFEPSIGTLAWLAKRYGVTTEYLIHGRDAV